MGAPASVDRLAPVWFETAGRYLGTREIPGPKSNPTILRWALQQGGWISRYFVNDDIPWCALFVGGVLEECGITGTRSLAARSFETWGRALDTPALGAVLVFSRNGGGHVGFYAGEQQNGGPFLVRGGNQRNAVTDDWIDRDRLVAVRWPYQFADGRLIALPSRPRRVFLLDDGRRVSVNER